MRRETLFTLLVGNVLPPQSHPSENWYMMKPSTSKVVQLCVEVWGSNSRDALAF